MTYNENSGGAGPGKQSDAHTGEEQWNDRSDGSENTKFTQTSVPSFRPAELNDFGDTGHDLIKLNSPKALSKDGKSIGKAPQQKGWREADPMSVEEAKEHLEGGCNVGARLRICDLVLDVDPRNFAADDDPLLRLGKKLDIDWSDFPKVVTGSDGYHFYMSIPEGLLVSDTLEDYPGLEFKSHGRQMVAPGSVHPDTGRCYIWDPLTIPINETPDAPQKLLELIKRPDRVNNNHTGGGRTPEQLEEMLSGLTVAEYREHDVWLELMMASHHATGGDGRQEFIEWSIGDPLYSSDEWRIGRRWDSLHADAEGRRVTEKTLFKALHKLGKANLIPNDDPADDFPDDLSKQPIRQNRHGVVDEWVYVIGPERFVHRADCRKWNKGQWKSKFASLKPDGDVLNAVWKDNIPIRKLDDLVYLPGDSEFPDGENGECYNIWRESGVDAKVGDVGIFLDHIRYLFEDTAEREHVLDYLAMAVQKPGQKINYALLVKGAQGTGKSWLTQLMTKIIGQRNVTVPSNDEVRSQWTVWTEGANLGIIEELMLDGRKDVAGRLKPIITEPLLRIEEKGFSHYSIPNKLNLMAFTNHEDAIPIEDGDRRWLVVFSDATPKEEKYYARLFGFLAGDGPAAVKHWLLQRKVALNPKGMAPKTKGKQAMRQLSMGEAEQFLSESLEDRLPPFDFPLVRFEDILDSIPKNVDRFGKRLRHRLTEWLLNEASAIKHTRYTKSGDPNRPNYVLWSIEDHEEWDRIGPSARIEAFMKHNADFK